MHEESLQCCLACRLRLQTHAATTTEQAKARWKRSCRDMANLAAAKSIISDAAAPPPAGAGAPANAAAPGSSGRGVPAVAALTGGRAGSVGGPLAAGLALPPPPALPRFRPAGTLPELVALLQQAAAELPYYE